MNKVKYVLDGIEHYIGLYTNDYGLMDYNEEKETKLRNDLMDLLDEVYPKNHYSVIERVVEPPWFDNYGTGLIVVSFYDKDSDTLYTQEIVCNV